MGQSPTNCESPPSCHEGEFCIYVGIVGNYMAVSAHGSSGQYPQANDRTTGLPSATLKQLELILPWLMPDVKQV